MKVKIYPSKVSGQITIPPSKSMAHRAIICASLADGISTISNIAYSEDIKATLNAMKSLGANIECFENKVIIQGINSFKNLKNTIIDCNESGSTLRFLIPIFSLCNQKIIFTGKKSLLKRPQSIYENLFKKQNLLYIQEEDKIEIKGSLYSGNYEIDGNISSQFISGLLFTLPFLEEDSTIHIHEPFESRSYVDLTIQMLSNFGIDVSYKDKNTLYIPGKQVYKPFNYVVESDYSQAAFFCVLACINNTLTLKNMNLSSLQGDKAIFTILKQANANISMNDDIIIHKSNLLESNIDLKNCPDLGPILMIMAMYAKGKTCIYNAERLRYKESDRISAMEEELLKCGCDITTTNDCVYIVGKPSYEGNYIFESHNDHRIAMSLSIAATMFNHPIIINQAEAIQKSYPSFFEDLQSLNVKVEYIYD